MDELVNNPLFSFLAEELAAVGIRLDNVTRDVNQLTQDNEVLRDRVRMEEGRSDHLLNYAMELESRLEAFEQLVYHLTHDEVAFVRDTTIAQMEHLTQHGDVVADDFDRILGELANEHEEEEWSMSIEELFEV